MSIHPGHDVNETTTDTGATFQYAPTESTVDDPEKGSTVNSVYEKRIGQLQDLMGFYTGVLVGFFVLTIVTCVIFVTSSVLDRPCLSNAMHGNTVWFTALLGLPAHAYVFAWFKRRFRTLPPSQNPGDMTDDQVKTTLKPLIIAMVTTWVYRLLIARYLLVSRWYGENEISWIVTLVGCLGACGFVGYHHFKGTLTGYDNLFIANMICNFCFLIAIGIEFSFYVTTSSVVMLIGIIIYLVAHLVPTQLPNITYKALDSIFFSGLCVFFLGVNLIVPPFCEFPDDKKSGSFSIVGLTSMVLALGGWLSVFLKYKDVKCTVCNQLGID